MCPSGVVGARVDVSSVNLLQVAGEKHERIRRMSISNRFRDIARDVAAFRAQLKDSDPRAEPGARVVKKASNVLEEWVEQVGDIPRMRLEFQLTPILLKAHDSLDKARLIFEEANLDTQADASWELQQKIYRLLNDL
jgi:hypothetical protein